jgi:peptidoglycan LD-endopeptidase LytH
MAPILFAGPPQSPQDQPKTSPSSDDVATGADSDSINSINLIIPVEGVHPNELHDTFNAARSGGRRHHAIDILAPRGTPVLAAADGEIIRLSWNKAGGNTIYQMNEDRKLIFYYAHLDSYADDLAPGGYARKGDVIGYVGDTGNAGAGNCHLHFSIWVVTDPKKYWQGANINPYPILREAR